MKIKLNIEAFGVMPGTVTTVDPERGERMVRNGDATAVDEPKPENKSRTKRSKPENKSRTKRSKPENKSRTKRSKPENKSLSAE